LRIDEARILQWLQVDFDANHITAGRAKSLPGRGRQIPVTVALVATLTQYRARQESMLGAVQPDWYVFWCPIGYNRSIRLAR